MTPKLLRFLANHAQDTPLLVADLDIFTQKQLKLCKLMPDSSIYYAVKAKPEPEILKLLAKIGVDFESASLFEIEQSSAGLLIRGCLTSPG